MKHNFLISCCALCSILFLSCTKEQPRTQAVMDTVCSVNLFNDGTKQLYDKIFFRLNEIEQTFSVTVPYSEISKINSMAGISSVEVNDDVIKVLTIALQIAKISNEAFNPIAGSLIDLWGINTDHAKVPQETEIQQALELTDLTNIEISANKVYLKKSGTKINLGAIVKGFAADEICTILKEHNVKKAVIDLGGNIYVYGKKSKNEKWIIGIKNPNFPQGQPLLKLLTTETSIVTSGIYERYFESNGKKYHHIFDLKTGFPSENGVLSATVISSSSLLADALSTTVFVLGSKKSFQLLPSLKQQFNAEISLIFICDDGKILASQDLKNTLESLEDEKQIIFIE